MIKRIITPLSLLLFIITCGTFGWYQYIRHSIIPTHEKNLTTIAANRAHEINMHLNEQEKNAVNLSQEPVIIQYFYNIPENKQELSNLISSHQEPMGFKNVLLIDKNGTIIFSTKQDLINENIDNHTDSSLGKSYERATMTLTNDFSNFNFNELLQEPALFITIPILQEKKFLGTLSYQLDEEEIYLITNQYIGLGKTGEVSLGKKEEKYAIFLSPTRHDPDLAFKKRTLFTNPPLSIQAAILGQEGSGKAIDYRGKKVIGAWKFIPKLDWGMIVKIDQDEILEPTYKIHTLFLFFLLMFLISLLINTYLFFPIIERELIKLNSSFPCNKIPAIAKNPLFILLLFSLGFTIKNIVQCERKKSFSIEQAKQQAIENNTENAENITTLLEKIAFIGQSIANDLRTNYLKKDDIATRIDRDATENTIITNITVAFAPYSYDEKIETHVESTSNTSKETTNIFQTKWYKDALEKKSTWIINSIKNNPEEIPTATYACTFFDKNNELNGVIAITFSLPDIIHSLEYNGIGQTGYSIITSDTGELIFHPIASLVHNQMTLLQFAQSEGNEELASTAQKALSGKSLIASYRSPTTKETYWIATQPIRTNNWTVGTIFAEDEVGLSARKIRHYYFWILLWLITTLLIAASLLYFHTIIPKTAYTTIINLVPLLGLLTVWYAITITHTINRDSITIITDQSSLDKFLNDLNEEAYRKHEPKPINISCGLLLYTLNIPDPDHMEISGYIWTKYNTTEHTNIVHGIDILQSTRMVVGKPLTSTTGNWETETWSVQGLLSQGESNTQYPFDQQQLRIVLEHRDIEKNIILTPDLAAYKKLSPESTPGLDKEFSISGFTVEQTFFEYRQVDPNANFGFKEYGKVTDHFQLIYNVILNRNLLNPLVLYILPLLVILFSLFCTLLIGGKMRDPFSMLGPYTGLFFSLIVLQRSLREQHPSGSTLYIEYAFFYTYITIMLLILHTILNHFYKYKNSYKDKALHLMKLLFWPFQFITWFITTLIVFY